MSNILGFMLWYGAGVALYRFLSRWSVTRCRCGRPATIFWGDPHERHSIMILRALVLTSCVLACIFRSARGPAIFFTIVAFWQWYIAKKHGQGRRKWPKKLAGSVKINNHGRLVVVNH